jgi:hypothetical protein
LSGDPCSSIHWQWFLQPLSWAAEDYLHQTEEQGDDGSKGEGVINIAIRQLQEKFVFMKKLSSDIGDVSQSSVTLSFPYSSKWLQGHNFAPRHS